MPEIHVHTWNSICPLGVNLYETRGIRSSKSKSKSTLDLDIIKLCHMSLPSLTTYPLLLLLSLVFCIFQLAAQFYFCCCYFHLHKERGIHCFDVSLTLPSLPPSPPLDGFAYWIWWWNNWNSPRNKSQMNSTKAQKSLKNWNILKNRSRRRWQNVRVEFVRFIR